MILAIAVLLGVREQNQVTQHLEPTALVNTRSPQQLLHLN